MKNVKITKNIDNTVKSVFSESVDVSEPFITVPSSIWRQFEIVPFDKLKVNNGVLVIDIAHLITKKLAELKTSYNKANELDITYMSTTFQADKKSQDLIVYVLSAGSVPTGFFWVDKSNAQIPMTFAQLQGLSGAILTRNQVNFVKFQGLKTKAKLATAQAKLDLIVW